MDGRARAICIVVAVIAATSLSATPVAAAGGHTFVVPPGQPIQPVVDAAKAGDTIRLSAGVYKENVLITTDRLTLRGAGAGKTFLEPPASDNGCGICVFGAGVPFGTITRMVVGDHVTDLTARNYAFAGVFGYGTDGLQVTHVDAANNAGYGISRFASTRTLFKDNRAWGSHEAGFYVGDSPDAQTLVIGNQAWNNDLGFFVRHAHGVTLRENNAWANCFGILVLDDGQPGGAGDETISDNHLSNNNQFCPATGEGPPHGGAGVVLFGAVNTVVRDNEVKNNHIPQTSALGRGGVVLLSAAPFGGAAPSGNTVHDNDIQNNAPADIVWDSSGTNNRFFDNDCRTSIPPNLCGHDRNNGHD